MAEPEIGTLEVEQLGELDTGSRILIRRFRSWLIKAKEK